MHENLYIETISGIEVYGLSSVLCIRFIVTAVCQLGLDVYAIDHILQL